MKNAKNGQFWIVFENLKFVVKQCYQTFSGQKLVGNARIQKLKCDISGDFQILWTVEAKRESSLSA